MDQQRGDLILALSLPWRTFYPSDFKSSVATSSEEFVGYFFFPVGKPVRISSIPLNILMRRGGEEIFWAVEAISHLYRGFRRLQIFPRIRSLENKRWECDERRWNLDTVQSVSFCAKFKLTLAFKVEVLYHSNKLNKRIADFSVCLKLHFTFKNEDVVNGCPTNANYIAFVNYSSLNSEILFLPLL